MPDLRTEGGKTRGGVRYGLESLARPIGIWCSDGEQHMLARLKATARRVRARPDRGGRTRGEERRKAGRDDGRDAEMARVCRRTSLRGTGGKNKKKVGELCAVEERHSQRGHRQFA